MGERGSRRLRRLAQRTGLSADRAGADCPAWLDLPLATPRPGAGVPACPHFGTQAAANPGQGRVLRFTKTQFEPLTRALRAGQGFAVETGSQRIECSRLAIALPPAMGADLLKDVAPELARSLVSIRSAAVDSVGIVARAEHTHLPRVASIFPIGDIFLSVVSRDVVPDPDRRGLAFHFRTGLPLDQRVSRVCEVTGIRREQFLLLATHHATLPSPALGHADIVKAIDTQLPRTGLYVVGNYFGGLALEDCSLRAASEAERFMAESA